MTTAHSRSPSTRTCTHLLAAALLAASPAALRAQGASADPVLARMRTLALDSSQIQRLAFSLLDSIGPRLTGTPGLENAATWLVRQYTDWGITARTERYGTWTGWERGTTHVDLLVPRVRTLDATLMSWSPGTGDSAVTAPVEVLPEFTSSEAFARWLPSARGKIILLSPALPSCRGSEDWFRYADETVRARMEAQFTKLQTDWLDRVRATGLALDRGTGSLGARLDSAGVAAVIVSNPMINFRRGGGMPAALMGNNASAYPGSGGWGTVQVQGTLNRRAPAITMDCEDYGLIFRLASNGATPRLRVQAKAAFTGEVPTFNTVASIPGTEKPNEYVLLSAHLDSWDAASGATDNGSGTLVMMEAMRILRQVLPRPKRTILVGHWGGEEQGLNGSLAFAEDHPALMRGVQVVFNQDNGTGRIRMAGAVGLPAIDAHMKAWLGALAPDWSESVRWRFIGVAPGTRSGSDDGTFACHGVPTVGLDGLAWSYTTYTWHSTRDTFDKLVFDDLSYNAALVAMLAYQASEDPTTVSRERVTAPWPTQCAKAARMWAP